LIGNYPIGSYAIGSTAQILIFSEDTIIYNQIKDNYPADLTALESNFEVDAFKDNTTAGTCFEYFNGKLYFAVNNYVYCTKTFDIEHVDVRYMVVAGFPENVTGIARVNDGLYIGTTNNTYFLKGTSPLPEDGGFSQTHIAKYGIVPGTITRFQGDMVPDVKGKDTVVLWASKLGIFAGGDGGNYSCLSLNQINIPAGSQGTAMVTEQNGIYQYVVCYNVSSNLFVNKSDGVVLDSPSTMDTIVVNLITNTHSRYTNYAFNSFFKKNSKWYGANTTGIYLLEGDYDFVGEGTESEINAFVKTPVIDFGKEENKAVCDALVNARAFDNLELDIKINEERECLALPANYTNKAGIQRRRIKVPKGLVGNAWQFTVRNVNGAYFKMFDFEVMAKTVQRRI
jgi:hypothetical protein